MKRLIYILLFCLPVGGFSQGFLLNPYAYGGASADLLLDSFPGAEAAYSLRKLDKDYLGSCIRVRRSSDNAEQDIGFVGNYLDTASLLTFCGAGDGFVTTWYGQSGNTRNAVQSTAASQPSIVSAGTLRSYGGYPCIQRDGQTVVIPSDVTGLTNQSIFTALALRDDVTNESSASVVWVANSTVYSNGFSFGGTTVKLSNERIGWLQAQTTNVFGYGQTTTNIPEGKYVYSNLFQFSPISAQIYQNGALLTLINTTDGPFSAGVYPSVWNTGRTASMASFKDHSVYEIILYPTYQSTNRAAIESNINSFYAIY